MDMEVQMHHLFFSPRMQACSGNIVGLVPDDHDEVTISIKQITSIFWFPSA